jgi:hypothetical protein
MCIIFTPCTHFPLFVHVFRSREVAAAVLSLWAEIKDVDCVSDKKAMFPWWFLMTRGKCMNHLCRGGVLVFHWHANISTSNSK